MKHLLLSVTILLYGTQLSFSQEIDEISIARTVSLYFAIADYCPDYNNINIDLAKKLGEASYNVGMNTYGKEHFYNIAGKEFDRRKQEVIITGEKQWCSYQYSHQKLTSGHKDANPFVE